ncbi:MAG: hypothetical protein RLZZ403_1449 [Pseudomonadota bacterium]|jgi:hypothetical protein
MSATNAPFGLRPASHLSGGAIRALQYTIDPAYTTAIYLGSPVILHTDGTIRVAAAGNSILGAFQGCEYTNSLGSRKVSPYWTGEASATDIICYITADPQIIYEIQADGAIAQAKVGESADFTATATGSLITGVSAATIANGTAAAAATLQVIGFSTLPDNTPGDAFTIVRVKIAEHQLAAAYSGV